MRLKNYALSLAFLVFSFTGFSQTNDAETPTVETPVNYMGTVSSMEYVPPIASRMSELVPAVNSSGEARDKRSLGNQVIIGKDQQTVDLLAANPDPDPGLEVIRHLIIHNTCRTDGIHPNSILFNTKGGFLLGTAHMNDVCSLRTANVADISCDGVLSGCEATPKYIFNPQFLCRL